MHFIGTTTTAIAHGDTTSTLAGDGLNKTTNFEAGDVVIYNKKEFVWTGAAWNELGDEGSFAYKTVTITGTGALSGGGSLEENRTITHNTYSSAGSYGPAANVSGTDGSSISIPNFTVDSYGHVSAAGSFTFTAVDHTYSAGDGISLSGSEFSLKNASTSEVGGFVASNALNTAVSLTSGNGATADRYYGVQIDNAGVAFVNIPWQVNTDSYIDSGTFSSEGVNGADGGNIALSRIGTSSATVNISLPLAAGDAAGLMSGAQYTKLAGIADGATAVTESTVSGWGFTKNTGTVINNDGNLTSNQIILGNGTVNVKASGKTISTIAPSVSSDDNAVPTSAAVWSAISNASGYGCVGTITSITPGDGIVNGSGSKTAITDSGTLKVALTDYVASAYSAQTKGSSETRIYAVELDADGALAVTVPWTDTTYGVISSEDINTICTL